MNTRSAGPADAHVGGRPGYDNLDGMLMYADAELQRRRGRLRRQNIACGVLAFVLAGLVALTPIALVLWDALP